MLQFARNTKSQDEKSKKRNYAEFSVTGETQKDLSTLFFLAAGVKMREYNTLARLYLRSEEMNFSLRKSQSVEKTIFVVKI